VDLLAHGTEVLVLEPRLDAVAVVEVSLVTCKRSNIVLAVFEGLQANDALVHHVLAPDT